MDGGLGGRQAPLAPALGGTLSPLVSAGELKVWCGWGLVVPLKST